MVKYLYPIPKFYESGETMLNFRPICLEDRAWIEPVMQAAAGHGSEFSFVNLFLWGDQRVASVDGTPVFHIKPYLPYSDCFPDARAGFTALAPDLLLDVDFPPELLAHIPEVHRSALLGVLSHDPRPSYQDDPARRYGMGFAGFDIHFTVSEGRLTVVDVVPMEPSEKGSASQ